MKLIQKITKDNKEQKEKTNIIGYFIRMILILIMFDIFIQLVPKTLTLYLIKGKYVNSFILESVCIICALIAMLIAGNSYVFKEKKEGLIKSLLIGAVPIIISLASFTSNIGPALKNSLPNVISLAFYCISIGLYEEFLCRGWIQNEIVERYSKNIKQAIVSIFLSSLIFGGMHITNIWLGGQTVTETIAQIIQATGMGFLLGSIYFRTKNIWSTVIIHAFWDFSLMLQDSMTIKSCTYGTPSKSVLTFQLGITIILAITYILIGLFILRKTKNKDYFEEVEQINVKKEKNKNSLIALIILIFCLLPINAPVEELENYQICYEFEEAKLNNYDIVYQYNKNKSLDINYVTYEDSEQIPVKILVDNEENELKINTKEEINKTLSLSLKQVDDSIYLIDNINEKEYKLKYENVFDYEIIENNNKFVIIIVTRTNTGDSIVYYNDYINVDNLKENDDINKIINSFDKIDNVLDINKIGYVHDYDTNYNYPLVQNNYDSVIINESKEVLVLK